MLDVEKFKINQCLNSLDGNPFFSAVTLDKNVGFVVKSNESTTATNVAKVILTKDKVAEQGYRTSNCFLCLPYCQDYRFIHLF